MTNDLELVIGGLRERQDPIGGIQATLRKYPHAAVDLSAGRVAVHPVDATGFEVVFIDRPPRYRVYCAGWYEDFRDSELALECFFLGLSASARLEVWRRGGMSYRWQLQALKDGRWVPRRSVRMPVFPFWRGRQVAFLQNRLLEAA